MPRCHCYCSDPENGPTYDQQLDAEQIQRLIDQRITVLHLDSCPQRPCLPVMLPTGMPTYGSQMPEAERILSLADQRIKDYLGAAGSQQALIPGYGGQPMSMPPPGDPSMPMQMNGLLRPPTMGPPPTVPGGITPTSNAPPNPGAMHQGNPTALASGAFDGCNINEAASGLQRPTQGSAIATSCLLTNEQGSSYLAQHVREAKKLAKESRVRFGSWNLGSLTLRGELRDAIDTAARRRVNILCVQEIKWSRRKKAKVEKAGFEVHKQNAVGILIDKSLKTRIFGVRRKPRIILAKLIVSDMVLNVISASAPQVGASEHAKLKFWKDLNGMVRGVRRSEKLFIGGDFHGHVGSSKEGFERVHGGFGYGDKNQRGEEILNFAVANDLMVANTFFRKTFINGLNSSQINFILARRQDRPECKGCKVIPEGCVISEHQLLVSDFVFGDNFTPWKLPEDPPRVFKDRMMAGVSKKRKKNHGRSVQHRRYSKKCVS